MSTPRQAAGLIVLALAFAERPSEAALPVCGVGANAVTSVTPSPYTGADVGRGLVVRGTAEAGARAVTVTLAGTDAGTLTLPGGSTQQAWSLAIDASTIEARADGTLSIGARVVRGNGSTVTATAVSLVKNVTPPGPVTQLLATPATGQITVSWTNPTNADFSTTRVLRSTSGPATSPTASSTQTIVFEGSGRSFVDPSLPASTTFHYTAFARDTAGNWSTAVSVSATTPAGGTTPPGPATFTDNFETCNSTTNLGPNWTIAGRWYCTAGRARGESATTLAIARASPPANQTVEARVQLTGSASASGIVARQANGAYYAARMLSTNRVEVIRVSGGTTTVLASAAVAVGTTTRRIRLAVSGSTTVTLSVTFDGTPLLTTTDASAARLLAGTAGLLSGSVIRTQFDDFSVL